MKAQHYETLIRNVYHCGKTVKNGADASIYGEMEIAISALELRTMIDTEEGRQIKFQRCFATVRSNVRGAIEEGIRKLGGRGSDEDIISLNEMKVKLGFRFFDREELDRIIIRATDIFFKYGLYH